MSADLPRAARRADTDPLPPLGPRRVTGFAAMTATAMKAGLDARRFTARQLVDGLLAHIESHEPHLAALTTLDAEGARAAADAADARRARGGPLGPLTGLPMTVKDGIDVAGLPTTLGLPWMRHNRPAEDASLVRRLKAAGAIIMGKTALPFASYDWQTAPPGRPRARNPHDPTRTPGGSSGGAAAALAAGFTPLEVGSDVAGSIRLPASFCGVVGLRPSEGALPQRGHAHMPGQPTAMRHLSTVGPMARTVEDCRLLFEALRTPAPFLGPDRPLHPAPSVTLSGLRIGWCETLGDVPLPDVVVEAFADLRRRLADADARLEAHDPRGAIDFDRAYAVWGRIQGAELRWALPAPLRMWPGNWLTSLALRARFGPGRLARWVGRGMRGGRMAYLEALDARDAMAEQFDRWVAAVDVWAVPIGPPALTHQRTGAAIDVDGRPVPYGDLIGMYNCPLALFGGPCLAIPAARRGLPVGIQLVAPRWHDHRLLAIGAAIEAALGPGYRPPTPIFGAGLPAATGA